jgi:hypothetical protein
MTNQQILDKCKEQAETILQEVNTTPRGWQLWLMVRDDEITWTTVSESTRSTGPVFSRWGHQEETVDWETFSQELCQDLFNSRG